MELTWTKHTFQLQFEAHKVYEGSAHAIYHVPCAKLTKLRDCKRITSWEHNRPCNRQRVAALRGYQNRYKHVNGTIHLAYLKDKGLVCYEGNHRFQALSCDVPYVLVDILWNADFEDVKREFLAINSGENVSELYIKAVNDKITPAVKECIEEYMEDVIMKYPGCCGKGKSRTNRPMFFVDEFKDRIIRLYKYFSRQECTIERLIQALEYLNESYASGDKEIKYTKGKELSAKSHAKAHAMGFYLYCPSEPLSVKDVEWALQFV